MKLKRFVLVLLSVSMILCACGAPTERESQSEQEAEAEAMTPELSPTILTDSDFPRLENEIARKSLSLFRRGVSFALKYESIANRLLSPEDMAEDSNWESKIDSNIYQGKIYENGKFVVHLYLSEISDDAVAQFADEVYQYDTTDFSPYAAKGNLENIKNYHFYKKSGIYDDYLCCVSNSFSVYANAEDIERYAKYKEVVSIKSADGLLESWKDSPQATHGNPG